MRCLVREELASPEQPRRQWAWTQEGSGRGSGARGCGRARLLLTTLPPAVRPGLRGPHTLDGACVPAPSRLFEGGGEAGLCSREDGGFVFCFHGGDGLAEPPTRSPGPCDSCEQDGQSRSRTGSHGPRGGGSPPTQRGWWAGVSLSASGSALKESCPAPPRPRAVASSDIRP